MILYNVTLKINPKIKEEWVSYMQQKHIPDVMATGLFTDYRFSHLLEQNEEEGITYVTQYVCNSLKEYNEYISKYAPALREEVLVKYKDMFVSFRTIMEVL